MTKELPDTMTNEERAPKIVVIGVGNLLMKDEGIGIHTIQHLQEINLPPDIELIDGGTSPDLLAYTEAGDKLIIVDAAKAGGEPGSIYRFLPEDLSDNNDVLTSSHELGVTENLKLMSLMGSEPREVVIIGIEPKEINWGTELTAELQQKVPEIVNIVLREIGINE